jgi:hypothetical protein
LESLARETLEKLGVVLQPGRAAREYLAGSTQIPAQVSLIPAAVASHVDFVLEAAKCTMRTISDEQERLIIDAIGENSLSLSPAMLEKDALVTEALRAISEIDLPGLTVTFSGGTCLAKAYQLLEKMSEEPSDPHSSDCPTSGYAPGTKIISCRSI